MFSNATHAVAPNVYRKKKVNTWGEADPVNLEPGQNHSAIYGSPYSHTLEWAVMAPRTTENSRQAAQYAPLTYSGITMMCGGDADVRSDDFIEWWDSNGKRWVYRVEGTESNNFLSPWTLEGGKEVHLGEVKPRPAVGRGE